MAVIAIFLIGSIILLAAAIFGTVAAVRRASAGKVKDENVGLLVRNHPYTLNPVIWMYLAAIVIFLGIILIVWLRGR